MPLPSILVIIAAALTPPAAAQSAETTDVTDISVSVHSYPESQRVPLCTRLGGRFGDEEIECAQDLIGVEIPELDPAATYETATGMVIIPEDDAGYEDCVATKGAVIDTKSDGTFQCEYTFDLTQTSMRWSGKAQISEIPADAEITLTAKDAKGGVLALNTTKKDKAPDLKSTTDADCRRNVCIQDAVMAPTSTGSTADVLLAHAGYFRFYYEVDGIHGITVVFDGLDVGLIDSVTLEVTTYQTEGEGDLAESVPTTTTTDIAMSHLSSVWMGGSPFVLPERVKVRVKSYNARGKTLTKDTVKVGSAIDDGQCGVSALPSDEDPLTVFALSALGGVGTGSSPTEYVALGQVISTDWPTDGTLPTHAEVAWENGETWSIPAHSYQRGAAAHITFKGDVEKETWVITLNGSKYGGCLISDGAVCIAGDAALQFSCSVEEGDDCELGDWTVAINSFAAHPDDLQSKFDLTLSPQTKVASTSAIPTLIADETLFDVVFGLTVNFSENPIGSDLIAKIKVLGEADSKGKQATLSRGKINGVVTSDFVEYACDDPSSGLLLQAMDPDETTVSRGDILIGGEPIDIEKTDGEEIILTVPPSISFKKNGTGTRQTAVNTNQTQQSELL